MSTTTPTTLTVDGILYVRGDQYRALWHDHHRTHQEPSPIKIVILQRGWCMVGRYEADESRIVLTNARVIRRWGTTRGLGEIAADGPTSDTVLDPAGRVEIHPLTTVAALDCDPDKWAAVL